MSIFEEYGAFMQYNELSVFEILRVKVFNLTINVRYMYGSCINISIHPNTEIQNPFPLPFAPSDPAECGFTCFTQKKPIKITF